MKRFNPSDPESIKPISIKKLGDDVIFVDSHTGAFAAFLYGVPEMLVYLGG